MKLSVFCSETNKHILPDLRLSLDAYFIEYKSVIFDTECSMDSSIPPMMECLSSSHFYLIIPTKEDLDSQWLSFVCGFSHLNPDDTLILCEESELPSWLHIYQKANDIDGLIQLVCNQLPKWSHQLSKSLALTTLQDRLKEHTHQDFVKAVQKGDRFMTAVFLEAGFEVNKLSADQASLLSVAARNGYSSICHILKDAGADINIISLDRNNTPLMDAASEGHMELVRFFIENGADLEVKSKSGQTALVLATGNNQLDCAEILLEAGADCDEKDSMGLSARKYAKLYQLSDLLAKMPPEVE